MNITPTDVAIVGGGPAGLMLAIELGCRNVPCVLLERNAAPSTFPKANATSARTMEHYRRRGLADEIRALGLPDDYPQDVAYFTRLSSHQLARFEGASRADVQREQQAKTTSGWPTPEPLHRAQQVFIEPILRRHAQAFPSVQVRFGAEVTKVAEARDQVSMDVRDLATGGFSTLEARYVVGCDGSRSMVRRAACIEFEGVSDTQREFFGGQMLSIYFRSTNLYDVLGKRKAWQYWAVNSVQRAVLVAVDGISTFNLGIQLKPGQTPEDIDYESVCRTVVGSTRDFDFDVIATMPWTAGYTLVAERFRKGRLMIAGDAAHLFTPTGGMGYNTSVDDAVNLGWKLAQVVSGTAPDNLLDSYEAERRPIAQRNTAFARRMADSIGKLPVPADLEESVEARLHLGAALNAHAAAEFDIPGLQLGLRYSDSPIVARESTAAPKDDPNIYTPSAYPGARAPHAMVDGHVLFDRFARDFTLLCFDQEDTQSWEAAAKGLGVSLATLRVTDPAIRALYGADRVLIRPDHHVAWRGQTSTSAQDAQVVLSMALGYCEPVHAVATAPYSPSVEVR